MSSARDHDDWRRARFGARRFDRDDDPMPPGGLCEAVYCTLHAKTGSWSPDFLEIVQRAYRGQIPRRFLARSAAIAADLARARTHQEDEDARAATAPRVTRVWLVHRDGREELLEEVPR